VNKTVSGSSIEKKYSYFSFHSSARILSTDRWEDKKALDIHHKSEMMKEIAKLRDKYHLHMKVEMFHEA